MNEMCEKVIEHTIENKDLLEKQGEYNLNKSIYELNENQVFNKYVRDIWEDFDEKDKESIYKSGDHLFSFTGGLKRNIQILNPIKGPFRSPLIRFFQKDSFKKQFNKDAFDVLSGAIRLFVHFGILKKPDNISNDVVLENIKKDSKNIKNKIRVLEKLAIFIPELKPALPIIKKIRPIVESSSDIAAKTMINKQQELNLNENNKNTKAEINMFVLPQNIKQQ